MEKFFNIIAVSCSLDNKVFSLLDIKKLVIFLIIFSNLFFDFLTYINWSNFSNEWNALFGKFFLWIFDNEIKWKKFYFISFCFCFYCCLTVYEKSETKLAYLWRTFNNIWFLVFHKTHFLFLSTYFFASQKQCLFLPGTYAKPGHAVIFMKNLASVDSLIFLPKSLKVY